MPQDIDYKYKVIVPWKSGDTITRWDEICIFAIEKFGLPGYRFKTDLDENQMTFCFINKDDAVYFSLAAI